MTRDQMGPRAISLLADGFVFCEAPRWHENALWFSDMHGEAIYRAGLDGGVTTVVSIPGLKPSGLGFLPEGDLLYVSMGERKVCRFDGTTSTLHADLSTLVHDDLNDMVVAADGRAYVGTFSLAPNDGVLVRIDPDGHAEVAARDLDFPNGAVITNDGSTLIVTESKARRHTAFEVDNAGGLQNPWTYAAYAAGAGDGLAVDADGALWSALPLANHFARILPGGEVVETIEFGDRMPVACALGGPDRRTLFLLSAPDVYPEKLIGRRDSRIDMVRVEVPGASIP